MTELISHPRLYVTRENLNRIKDEPDTPLLKAAWRQTQEVADEGLLSTEVPFNDAGHNSLLIRGRAMQQRIVTLAALWWKTGDEKYRAAVLDCVRAMGGWEYWSWIARRKNDASPDAIFDLSYGENSATLAIAYDWLFDSLSQEERELFVGIARRRSLQPFLHNTESEKPSWWMGKPDTNWNTVCAGGAGMLALAMMEELDEAQEVLVRAEKSVEPYMRHLETTGGGWPEGIGYWNYGMRYAFMYLRSWENAHGEEHPLLQLPSVRRTLHFPLDFTPNGCACSFGDVGHWMPLPFHYDMAARYVDEQLLARLDSFWKNDENPARRWGRSDWPSATELLLLHPRREAKSEPAQEQIAELYGSMGWGILADQMPQPRLYAAIRGGSTKVPHSHRDLMSFHLVVEDEKMIENFGPRGYLDTTFSPRRNEIFEIMPTSKNTLLVNAVGITVDSEAETTLEKFDNLDGIRLDATQAMGTMRDGPAALFCGRVIILLEDKAFLIVDRVEVQHAAQIEARFFSPHEIAVQESTATIRGQRQQLHMSFAATKPALLQTAQVMLTSPQDPSRNLLRWSTPDVTPQGVSFATLLIPGHVSSQPGVLRLSEETNEDQSTLMVQVEIAGWQKEIHLTSRLHSV